jgi:hypothetical protein
MFEGDIGTRYATRRLRALGHRFVVEADDPELGRYLDDVLCGLADDEPSVTELERYELTSEERSEVLRHTLRWEGHHLVTTAHASIAVDRLLWHLNRQTVARSQQHLLIHAAGVVRHGRGVVLPAAQEAGKTTLAAGLVRHGFGYLSDETVAIDARSGAALAYAKPLSIDPGSWAVLADLRPALARPLQELQREQWQVPADAIRAGSVVDRAPIRYVIAPRYVAGARTALSPLPRAQAVRVLAEQAFNFRGFPAGLQLLATVAGRADCYQLTVGSLTHACELVDQLVADVADPEEPRAGGDRS